MEKIVQLKRRKPTFVRVEYHRHKRLGKKWRRPKGHHGRIKKLLSYHKGASPKVGYGISAKFRNVHPSGYEGIMVYNVADLGKIKTETQAAVISDVGKKKKIEIVEKAISKNIKILNLRKPEEWLKQNVKKGARQPKEHPSPADQSVKTHDKGAKK